MQKDVIATFRVRKDDGTVKRWALFKSYFDTIEASMNMDRERLISHYEFLRDTLEEKGIIPHEDQLRGFLWKFACNCGRTNLQELRSLESTETPIDGYWSFTVKIGNKQKTKILNFAWIVKMSQELCVSYDIIDEAIYDVIAEIENKRYDDEIHYRDRLLNKLRKKTDTFENQYEALQ